jgi:hypothetical protein
MEMEIYFWIDRGGAVDGRSGQEKRTIWISGEKLLRWKARVTARGRKEAEEYASR